jgi:hypothetical protein
MVPEYRVRNVINQDFDKKGVRVFFPGRAAVHTYTQAHGQRLQRYIVISEHI